MMKWAYRSLKNGKEFRKYKREAYLREGVALQQLGQHGDALAAFAVGLAQDSSNTSLLSGLVDSALKSPLKEKLGPTFQQLQKLKLHQSPFVIISVIGQELLAAGLYGSSIAMLEAALQIGTCSLKLRGSVFSALSSAHWGLGNIDKAITYMQHDLSVAKSLGDIEGECRAHGNLGSAYFSKGHYKEALSNHRYQLALAMKLKHRQSAASALGSLGHVYTAIGDYPNALQSHKQCLFLNKQCGDKHAEAREIGNAGAVYLAMAEFSSAVECHNKHLEIAKKLNNSTEEARAYSNLGSAYHYKRDYEKAIKFHEQVLKIAEQKKDKVLEARAYAGLGHAARCKQDYETAKNYHEKQLDNALETKDKVAEGRACSNLGIIYHQLREYKSALKLHEVHLKIAKSLGDRASQGRALGNIGNAHIALKQYDQAVKYHKQEVAISSEVNDRHSEGATHGNLAVAYQALGMFDKAILHYMSHLNISKELKDTSSEARALCNLGNYYSSRGDYLSAVKYYEDYLILSQELHDSEGEAKACFNLGYVHFGLGNHLEAVRYYEQDLSIARELQDQLGIARAYCNLGLAHKALHNYMDALECQKKCLSMMKNMKNTKGIFRALGNIGDITLKTGDTSEAIKIYNQQLQLAKQCNSKDLVATAYGALGAAHRTLGQFDKALGYHTQELSIRQDMDDKRGECRAHGNLGNVHMSLGNYMNALKCYEEQLEKSQELQDSALEAQACGNLGITRMNMGSFEDAIGMFEQQLAMLEQVCSANSIYDKGRALGNLGDCYEALGDYEESIRCHEQYLATAQQANSLSDQDKAYRGLGNAHRSVGNLQQALVCFEKRLVVAHELNSSSAKASAYGELGCLHSLLGNFEQAISCLQHQLSIAKEIGDSMCEGEAACGLGGVYQNMGEYEKALEYHQMDLQIAETTENTACQCRAYGNLGLSHESLGNYNDAIQYQEQHLSIAAQMNDKVAKTLAYSSLGRVHHALNNHTQAVEYLKQGLSIAEQLGRHEDEAKICHRLGLSLWGKGDLEECQLQLHRAADLFEGIRRDAQLNSEYKMSLFDLQTACYQALQRVLVSLGRHDEALAIAERACTRAFIDYLLERQAGAEGLYRGNIDPPPVTPAQLTSIVGKQQALVMYYSIAAGYLYCWLVTPRNGIVKFHEVNMTELEADYDTSDTLSMKSVSFGSSSLIDQYVGHVRESMGVESHNIKASTGSINRTFNDGDSECDDVWQQHLEELGDKLNAENDKTGFLRMVNRNHKLNSSNYSLSSLFSLSTLNGVNSSFHSTRKNSLRIYNKSGHNSGAKTPLSVLYHILIEPMEEALETASEDYGAGTIDLVLVLQGELYLIPFSILKKDQKSECLFERFNISIMSSVTNLQNAQKHEKQGRPVIDSSGAVVVGNPKLSPGASQHWIFKDIPEAEYEARVVGELLTSRPLIGPDATKAAILHQIEQVEVIHFCTHISWKLSSIVLAPSENIPSQHRFPSIDSDDSSSDITGFDGPAMSEYLLTAADILNLKLHAKLVVLSSGYTDDRAGRINSDGVVGLTRALLSAGAKCVLYSLWPVPDDASKMLMRSLYTALQEGQSVTHALQHAMKAVQSARQYSHPANWGGWILVGHDIKLSSKIALMGHAICEILLSPGQCREAMRVLLHLIEKSLMRIHQGIKNSMYTTYTSIENKVGGIAGWKDLLKAVGFRFEAGQNDLPPAVFFPQSDPGDRLTQASSNLQALLGLPPSCLSALSKFLPNYDAGEANIRVMRDILSKMAAREVNVDVQLNVQLWRVPGCHEFFASLGLDLVEVGRDDVTLRLGKQAVRRQLQFALQSLVAVFDTQEAPRSLTMDSSSSLESLSSSHSGSTSTSNFSKGSTPPISPRCGKKKSLFNPAEMEKMRMMTKMQLMNQGGLSGRKVSSKSSKSGPVDPSLNLSHQNKIKNMYPPSNATMALHSDIDEMQEIVSENSESEFDCRRSEGAGSWNDFRMQVSSNNSESDGSTIPEGRHSSESEPLKTIEEHVDDTKVEICEEFEEYTFSRQASEMSADGDQFSHEFDREDSNRQSNMSAASSDVERTYFENQNMNRNSYSDSSQADDAFHRDDLKRQSDMSDTSGISDNFITSKSLTLTLPSELVTESGQLSSESGIHSEVTSNQSDASQQSMDVSQFPLNPSEIALRVLADVGPEHAALEEVQSQSIAVSQKESFQQRTKFFNSLSSGGNSSNFKAVQQLMSGGSVPNTQNSSEKIKPPVPQRGVKMPPPIPAKPKPSQNLSENFQKLKLSNQNSGNNSVQTNKPLSEQEKSESYDFEDDLSYTITTSSNRKGVKILKSGDSNSTFSSFKPPQKGNFLLNSSRPESSASLSSVYSTGSSVQTVIHRSRKGMSPNIAANIHSPEQFTNGRRQSPATSGSDNDIRIRTGLAHSSWYNVDSDSSQNALFEKRCSNSSLSSTSSFSDVNNQRKTKSILNGSPNNPRPRGKKPRKRVSFSDSEPSDLDSSNHSRSLHDISPVDGYVSPLSRSRNIYQGFHSRTPSPYANKTVPKQNQNSAGNDSVKWEPVINGGVPNPLMINGTLTQEQVLNGSVPNLTGNSADNSNFRASTGTIPNYNNTNGNMPNYYPNSNANMTGFSGTTFIKQGTSFSPQSIGNSRNLSTFGQSAFNHMSSQPQSNLQSTNNMNNGSIPNFNGTTFNKRPNNLTSQSSNHIQMLYSGQQRPQSSRPQQVMQSSKC
ncbi:uncharacterized protein LOC143076268 isoform X2 [Mytilus galloprovincialis]|uniref:uncharacterized protein LOC143076268 isoform X2 n=1 Tax=Mytilus galloprovincialis TaxID=29158 RepID=UPI003F7BBD4A